MTSHLTFWSRRAWLARNSAFLGATGLSWKRALRHAPELARQASPDYTPTPTRETFADTPLMQALATRAIDAATAAGAQYADVRLSRITKHTYGCMEQCRFEHDEELVGVGVRTLVDGYWGFAASPFWNTDEVVQLARNAVAQAKENAKGPTRRVELGQIPVVTGTWTTPVKIDPFSVTIEEKRDTIQYWRMCAEQANVPFWQDGLMSGLQFVRHERVLATSEGSLVTQTTYESSGTIKCGTERGNGISGVGGNSATHAVQGIDVAGKGWELFTEANLPEQFLTMQNNDLHGTGSQVMQGGAATVGRYTLVCDGATMASLVEQTLGVGTQLDRALGYEANAHGTSFLDDPLSMVGSFHVTSPLVTITANRSAPAQLATIKWDDEGVVPAEATLVKDGVIVDFQTTREQAAWLAPYYQKHDKPVHSNGFASSESALAITLQHMPNLAMTPNPSDIGIGDLIADVANGIYIQGGGARCDFQARGGMLEGDMREIKNGKLGRALSAGAVLFDTLDLWKKVVAIGGVNTLGGINTTQYGFFEGGMKGEPPQSTSHSVRAVAATITNQPVINPLRKA